MPWLACQSARDTSVRVELPGGQGNGAQHMPQGVRCGATEDLEFDHVGPRPETAKALSAFPQLRALYCSRDKTRTYNLPVNSRLLCQLSYAGPSLAAGRRPARCLCFG